MNLNRFINKYIDIQIEREKVEARKLYPEFVVLKGSQVLDVGYIFAPYIPVMKTPVLDYKPMKDIMTRYEKRVINNSFYGRVTI
jgi:hypothetical protein